MQNKGFVRVFAVLLTLVCLFYLSFSFVTQKYNKQAAEYAGEDTSKKSFYIDSLANKKVWLGYSLKDCREMEITLGLDLKGGMNVVLELNVPDVIRALSNHNQDPNFNKALDLAYARQTTSQKDFIDLFVEEYKNLDSGARLSAIFSTFELKEKITPSSTDAQVVSVIRAELRSAIDNSYNVLRTRIDRFGVVSPNIQRLETTGRILVELPGVKEPERVRKLLQGTANLEFWETYNLTDIVRQLQSADEVLAQVVKTDDPADADTTATTDATSVPEVTPENPAKSAADTTKSSSDVDSLLAQLGENTDETASTANDAEALAKFRKEHPLFSILQLNVDETGTRIIPGPVVGYAQKSNMAKVLEYLNLPQVKAVLPRNVIFKWGVKSFDADGKLFELYAIKVTNRDGSPALGGNVVTNANADFAQQKIGRAEQQVSMAMNAEGAKNWARLTKENIGNCIAIVLDDMVYSAPRVNDEITGGHSQITGHFSAEEAKDLANVLKSGKMAASINIVNEDVVGPSLGQEAIQAGIISFIVAFIALMIYMCMLYGFIPGMIANGALLLNIFFTLGILASYKAVLTMPGIAGMVLSLGMAVDANVLIYERAKEEMKAGKPFARAITDGYGNAFSAIFDGNLTAIIAGFVLFIFGTGSIKGFAWTMLIGVAASFLTAVFLTRLVYERFMTTDRFTKFTFSTKFSRKFLEFTPKINFLGMRKIGYAIPIILIVLGGIAMGTIGLNSGIDFTGGRNFIIRFDEPVRTDDVRESLDEHFEGSVGVITIGSSNQIRVSTNYKIDDNGPDVDSEIAAKLYEGLQEYLPQGTTLEQFTTENIRSQQKVGPTMADDIRNGAIMAVFVAMIFMSLYVLVTFRDFAFSVGVFFSVLVTSLCIIAVYALLWRILPFSMEIDQEFIAAILTIIGYSLNDTVVVFDRVRETIKNYPKRDRFIVINDALNQTLNRTLNTSFATILVVFWMFVLGGATIRSFNFSIIIGIIIATYATLFIATPIAYEIQKYRLSKKGIPFETGNV